VRVIDLPRGDSPGAVLALAARELAAAGDVPSAAEVEQALLRREAQGSTGVGNGVAIPHAIVGGLSRPVMVLVRVPDGVAWAAPDGKPVQLILAIVAGEGQRSEYFHVLAHAARALGNPHARQRILKARSLQAAARAFEEAAEPSLLVRSRPVILLVVCVVAAYLAARLLMPLVRLPAGGVYESLGLLRFNNEPWLGRQALVVAVFLGMIVGTLLFWKLRLAVVAVGLAALLMANVIHLDAMVEYMSLPTIIFVMAMMVLIKWLEDKGVFRYAVLKAVERIGGDPRVLLIALMVFSVLLSGFVGEVSGILVTFGLAAEISRRTRTPLIPYLLALVFATNIGSALTLVGNPIGVYLAFVGGLTFESFLRWATPLALLASLVVGGLVVLLFWRSLRTTEKMDLAELEHRVETVKPADMRLGLLTFLGVIASIVLHARAENLLHLPEGTLLMVGPLAAVAFVLFVEQEKGRILIARSIDWWTLLFFMFLFASAACLEHAGVTTKLGYLLLRAAQESPLAGWLGPSGVTSSALILMLWGSGIGSGFVDNMPIVAALVPVVKSLLAVGLPHASILWWALLFGGCFGGNLTMVGSSANLVACGMYERVSGQPVSFGEWFRAGFIITAASLLAATIGLILQVRISP